MKVFSKTLILTAVTLGLSWSGGASAVPSGVIFLLGTDAVGFHGDASYINPVFDQMANFGTKTLLFVNDYGASSVNYTAGNIMIDFQPLSFLDTGADLSLYSGIYVDSPGTCCSDPGPFMAGGGSALLTSFVSGGGSLGVGDFQGDDFWDAILGFDALPGVTSGLPDATCEDPGVSTAGGLAFGFDPSYTEGCFVHQTYDPTFWAGKGYFALQTNGARSETFGDWVTMATGFRDPGDPEVPVPATLYLLGLGLAAVGASRRRKKA